MDNFLKIKKGLSLPGISSPVNPINGDFFYDATRNTFSRYNGGAFADVQSSSSVVTTASMTSADFTATIVRSTVLRLTGSTASNIHGLAASADAKEILLYNNSSATLTIKNQSATETTAANRILTFNNSDVPLPAGQSIKLVYDLAQSRWLGISSSISVPPVLTWNSVTIATVAPTFNVRVATTVNGVLATAFHNASVVDGVTLATNDLILLKNQTVTTDDGVYVVQASGAPVRSVSYNTFALLNYAWVHVTAGTTNANSNWGQNNILSSLSDPQLWSNSQTVAYTTAANVNFMFALGGGGGGGGAGTKQGVGSAGGGGGAGGTPQFVGFPLAPSTLLAITLGSAGKGGPPSGGGAASNGTAGQATTVNGTGVTLMFPGGAGGQNAGAAAGPGGAAFNPVITGMLATINSGGNGGAGASNGSSPPRSLTQAAVSSGGLGGTVAGNAAGGGGGGGSGFGPGANGGNSQNSNPPTPAAATNPSSGGGGCGGANASGGAGGRGGDGAPGQVIFYWL